MKTACKLSALLLVLVLLGTLCACSASTIEEIIYSIKPKPVETAYTATYDLNYDNEKIVVSYVSAAGYTPHSPTRPGYEFQYWTLKEDPDTPMDGVIPSGYTGNVNFVAVWEMATYRLVYENLTDEELSAMPKTFTIEDEIVIPDPERLGYRFLGWNAELQTGLTLPAGQTGDCVLHANWASVAIRSFVAASNVESIPVSASFEGQTLGFGTVVHASAPVLQNDYRFVRWEMNGTTVCTTAVYTFPLSKADTYLEAVYERQAFVEWTKTDNTDLTISDLLSGEPGLILGGGIRSGDYSFTEDGVTLKAAYLAKLEPGDYSFCVAKLSGGELGETRTFTLRLSGSSPEKPNYDNLPEAGKYYLYRYVSYQGKQLPLVASTDEEFCKLVEYSVLVGGVLKLQAEGKTTGDYELEIYIWGDLNRRLQAGESILATATASVSFPMSPKLGISYTQDSVGADAVLKVSYQKGLNAYKSSQTATTIADRQGLLTSPGREDGFETFPIDALTETAKVQTLYELETLPFGKKPVFADTAAGAEQIYQIARGVLRKIVDNGMTDYEKVTAIYNWIGLNITYDKVTAGNPDALTTSAYTLKGAFIDKLAVCDGYASAFRLLCQIEGIRADEVIGLKDLNNATSGHAWNKVWVGGAVFGVDTTWARQEVGGTGIVTSSYLFLDEIGLLRCEHYENAASGDFWVNDLATASIRTQASVAIDAQGHSLVIRSQTDLNAMISYLRKNGWTAGEFYIADGAITLSSTHEYDIYTSGKYGYILFK